MQLSGEMHFKFLLCSQKIFGSVFGSESENQSDMADGHIGELVEIGNTNLFSAPSDSLSAEGKKLTEKFYFFFKISTTHFIFLLLSCFLVNHAFSDDFFSFVFSFYIVLAINQSPLCPLLIRMRLIGH